MEKKKLIFVTDDDLVNLTVVSKALEKTYNVLTFKSGIRLLKALNATITAERPLPDLVILDIDMPEMNGYETIVEMKKSETFYKIPVVFLTAKCSPECELKGLALGAIDYITKPFSMPLLVKRIDMHLETINRNVQLTKSVGDLQTAIIAATSVLDYNISQEFRQEFNSKGEV